ncbi:unnamed protein product [Phytomonas sp. EM1]|nr:unnamed protein product [Phytomonas sp. EM1]|eukprot:CCW63539.1 unnamed protein product [Phytomonas sp. isolate EM1]
MIADAKASFDNAKRIYESVLIQFKGVDGYDVYNTSVPYTYQGKIYLYGRIEKRTEWSESRVRLFVQSGKDEFTLVPNQQNFHLEDPFASKIQDMMFFGGTRVVKNCGNVSLQYIDFYKGSVERPFYYTCGPDRMKYIRLVRLYGGGVGIFSTHSTANHYSPSFTTIEKLEDLNMDVIAKAMPLDLDSFADASCAVHQAYLLTSGKIGCICHHAYEEKREEDCPSTVYCITSFVYEPRTKKVLDIRVIATRNSFPNCSPKAPHVADCVFASGVVMREDGRCDLYAGIGNSHEGRVVIDYPFEGHGNISHDELKF